jgi:YesN/AraC family two-component response regulator
VLAPQGDPLSDALTILVADDEPLVRRSLNLLLTSAGFRVREAGGAAEGLLLMSQEQPSLVISDINMPGNEDLAFVRAITEKFPGLPVVLLTAYPTVETAVESVNLSVAAYLVKPPDAEKVLTVVRTVIGQYEAREAVQRSLARLGDWKRDLQQLETVMNNVRSATEANSSGAFLELTLRHMMSSLLDLREVVGVLASAPSGAESVRSLELSKAVQETIEVLERTKRVFKSKDLGELRQKLEVVMATMSGQR